MRAIKIVMIGEAAHHQDDLAAVLDTPAAIVELPAAAAADASYDAQIEGADVVVAMRFERPKGQAPNVPLLHVPGAGLDRIAFDALHADTVVCNAFEHEIPIAEYTLLAMLQHEIRLDEMRASFDNHRWSDRYRERVPHGELHGKTLGIIGFGRIGQTIATRARAFGMHVVALSGRTERGAVALPADQLIPRNEKDRLYRQSDYLVLACPLDASTRGMIDRDALAQMKRDAVLINVSRAPIVDEDALYEALLSRQLGAAYLDVWYQYPLGTDDVVAPSRHRFDQLPNAICTPHASAWTAGLFKRRYGFIGQNINRLRRGEDLLNVVHGDASALRRRLNA
ncbi:2-hydroxyacid dehydrogenase [Robbsia sp. KACC 23696]|uniref:2-hydroxyacid dehydrogenase n=1 Tax=Robbsia sp. KACC 23696 TaxID=3149231 RepID=UPI00325C2B8F